MPNTQTVTEFLSARIAEERERAEGAKWAMGPSWFVADPSSRADTYVASLNPDRTLADLAAKQWLIDRVGVLDDGTADQRPRRHEGRGGVRLPHLRLGPRRPSGLPRRVASLTHPRLHVHPLPT